MASSNPLLFKKALNTIENVLGSPSPGGEVVLRTGFASFIIVLAYQTERDREWARSTQGSDVLSIIVYHGVWGRIGEAIDNLPPGPDSIRAQKCMVTFDRVKKKVIAHETKGVSV